MSRVQVVRRDDAQWLAFRQQVASASKSELQALLAVLPWGRRGKDARRRQIVCQELRHRGTHFQRRGVV